MKKRIHISVRDFALPVPRKGSIDVFSGFGRGSEMGREIHQRIQTARALEDANYKSEVWISHTFETENYLFEVGGRMDGLIASEKPKIEEIKTNFNVYELFRRLKDARDEHPYCLQLKTYGYIFWKKNSVLPDLNLHLVSSRNEEAINFSLHFNPAKYEMWLNARLEELIQEAILAEKRAERRREVSKHLIFPFPKPRSGQEELISCIEEGFLAKQPMMLQAPTGLGKTIGVLYPNLKEALGRGQRVVYVTPKNSQHEVAQDAIDRLQEAGAKVKSMTITAKSKMCFKNEPLCNPEYCEYAKDHYTKVAAHDVLGKLRKKRSLSARTFKKIAEEFEVCPFEIQLDAAADVDTIICDYNYVFAPQSAFGRMTVTEVDQVGKPNLIIDEAHNLPSRTMDYYSPALSTFTLEKMKEDLNSLPLPIQKEFSVLLNSCIQVIKSCGPKDCQKPCKIDPPVGEFLAQDQILRAFLSSYLKSNVHIQPGDIVLRLCFYWSEFAHALEFITAGRKEFFTTFSPFPPAVRITCCDASEMLRDKYDAYEHIVAFSATLKPFDYYSRLAGLDSSKLKTAEFASPFPKENRKLLIIPQISSKYSERERNYPRIADSIRRIVSLKKGNYFAFFPSFEFLDRVYQQFSPPEDFLTLKQERRQRLEDVQTVLSKLKEPASRYIVFAVQGGIFSEGVDYPGNMAIGAFVVGPPLPNFDLEREKMREYYDEYYSAGFDYAYTYPAMAKAVQAAGRVIRSEDDSGIIVLMDNRFTQTSYAKSMPHDWFGDDPRELVSHQILEDISQFWRDVGDTNG